MMITSNKLKSYKKDYGYSYTIGAYPTIELLKHQTQAVQSVYLHSKLEQPILIEEICGRDIPVLYNDRIFERVGVNDNSYVLGVFNKYEGHLSLHKPHIVLVNPSDMGNLGTIIRTAIGFGYRDLAIITPAADYWNPKTIRSSMGALFQLNIQCFSSFEAYQAAFPAHELFPFVLGGNCRYNFETCPKITLFSLIFGNEASGLDNRFLSLGTPVQIPQTAQVDSLNLAVAVAIGAYHFAVRNGLV